MIKTPRLRPNQIVMPGQRKRRRKWALLAIPTVFFCVSAIYAAIIYLGSGTNDEPAASTDYSLIQGISDQEDTAQQQTNLMDFQSRIVPVDPLPTDTTSEEPYPQENNDLSDQLLETEIIPEEADISAQLETDPGRWLEETVTSGDSLALIFARMGLSPQELHQITHSGEEAEQLTNIKPGESLRIRLDQEDRLQELIYQPNPVESLHITQEGDSFQARTETKEIEHRTGYLSGTIESSFYLSAQKAGLSDALIMDLATIFGWDIDFALEIRKGDSFSVVYEEDFVDGDKYRNGRILAAEFTNQGKSYRAIRYNKDDGDYDYYSPDGNSMRKAFLRAPVDFRRISSHFAKERWHPVLGKKRPHRGVDYAAAIGTPIKAAGDGTVIFRGRKGGYGNTVIIKHGSQYSTLYGHMSRFRSSVKKGTKVRQGQIIGYVGKTGLATGPHLHYEFRINGVHKNPLTVKLPASAPIEAKYKTDFLKISKQYSDTLDLLKRALLAEKTNE